MATASDSVKFLRKVFSAYSPCTVTGISAQPSSWAARSRSWPAISVAVGLYDNRVKQADVVDVGGERGDVAHFAAVPLADDDFIDATHRHGTAPIVANRERTCRIVRALTMPAFVPSWSATHAFFACLALPSLTEKAIFSKAKES